MIQNMQKPSDQLSSPEISKTDSRHLPELLSSKDMTALGLSRSMFYRLIHREDMPVVTLFTRKYLIRDQFLELLRNGLTVE